jgi:hypothetical protein
LLYSACIHTNSQLSKVNTVFFGYPPLSKKIYLLRQPTSWRYYRQFIRHFLHRPISSPVAPPLFTIIITLHLKSQLPITLPLQAPSRKLIKNLTLISIIKPSLNTNSNHTSTWYVHPPFLAPLLEYHYSLLQGVTLIAYTTSKIRHMARLKSTARLVSHSNSQLTSFVQSPKQDTSNASGSCRKCLISTMDALALHISSSKPVHDTDDDLFMHLTNDNGSIAIRDWPDGCIPPCTISQVPSHSVVLEVHSFPSSRSRTRRRLLTIEDDDSDGSQGEKPSRASLSKASGSMRSPYQSLDPDKIESSIIPPTQKSPDPPSPGHHQLIFPSKIPQPTNLQHSAVSTPRRQAQDQPDTATSAPIPLVNSSFPTLIPSVTPLPVVKYADFVHHLWYSFSVHEMFNVQLGLPEFQTFGAINLADSSMPSSKIQEFHTCRHSFPHFPQRLLPTTKLDGIPGQYLHLTQIPHSSVVGTSIGLSHSYQILIRFDFGYNEMTKVEV